MKRGFPVAKQGPEFADER